MNDDNNPFPLKKRGLYFPFFHLLPDLLLCVAAVLECNYVTCTRIIFVYTRLKSIADVTNVLIGKSLTAFECFP